MSRAAKILIAVIMAFTASASHAKVMVVVSGVDDAVIELVLDGAHDRTPDVVTHRCASSTGSLANAHSSCPFETGTPAGALFAFRKNWPAGISWPHGSGLFRTNR